MNREERFALLDRAYVLYVTFKSGAEFELIAASVGVEPITLRDACHKAQSRLGIGPISWDYFLPSDEATAAMRPFLPTGDESK